MIVAHRGASFEAPENTIASFELAWCEGADAIEGDFRLTKDGYLVCMHDETTGRVTEKDVAVSDSTLSDLRKLDVGIYAGQAYKGTRIPTLSEVFRTVPKNRKIFVEIKDDEKVFPALLYDIDNSGLDYQQVVVISYNKNVIRILKNELPMVRAFLIVKFARRGSSRLEPACEDVLRLLGKIRADGLSVNKDNIDDSLVGAILEHGYECHVWTVDDPDEARRFIGWGVKSITTNVPGYMRKGLNERDHILSSELR